ncbi:MULTISPECIES: pro-sigmaK processing inhibitor BofA family protein [Psychrobacillus]|jgi:inhibitor of the pro-sigma K processing machinery|uniref:Pro-sigmaK processing inhibitor BofA family protein n=1 Tax=Psychrobacillus faecigallinarum TaxID=2762235 RepID=A0ABR8RFC8_9BACI|nr:MULTISPECIES: pro-sigmaK processing inhibitor BofA family protein [Psychrobacillus]MBD7946400.1 pro-sigmaK processing inhibitor BofA family protein [Psychrobacillus faecigallinarum]
MKLTIIVCSLVLLLFLVFKSSFSNLFESLSIFLFRLGFSILLLFGVHLLLGMAGYVVPINLFTGAVVAVLGVPGVASVVTISILL